MEGHCVSPQQIYILLQGYNTFFMYVVIYVFSDKSNFFSAYTQYGQDERQI